VFVALLDAVARDSARAGRNLALASVLRPRCPISPDIARRAALSPGGCGAGGRSRIERIGSNSFLREEISVAQI